MTRLPGSSPLAIMTLREVRDAGAAGAGLVAFDLTLGEVLWANAPGRAALGLSVGETSLDATSVIARQIKASARSVESWGEARILVRSSIGRASKAVVATLRRIEAAELVLLTLPGLRPAVSSDVAWAGSLLADSRLETAAIYDAGGALAATTAFRATDSLAEGIASFIAAGQALGEVEDPATQTTLALVGEGLVLVRQEPRPAAPAATEDAAEVLGAEEEPAPRSYFSVKRRKLSSDRGGRMSMNGLLQRWHTRQTGVDQPETIEDALPETPASDVELTATPDANPDAPMAAKPQILAPQGKVEPATPSRADDSSEAPSASATPAQSVEGTMSSPEPELPLAAADAGFPVETAADRAPVESADLPPEPESVVLLVDENAAIAPPLASDETPDAAASGDPAEAASEAEPAPSGTDERPAAVLLSEPEPAVEPAPAEPPAAEPMALQPLAAPDAILPSAEASTAALPFQPRFDMAPVRFVWQIDRDGKFRTLTPEFSAAVGPQAADVGGRSFREVATVFGFDGDGEIARLLDRRDTWSGRSILWPVEGSDRKVPVDLAALPIYARDRSFDGFRGFGIVRMNESVGDPEAIGMILGDRPVAAEAGALPVTDVLPEEAAEPAPGAAAVTAPEAQKPLLKTFEGASFGRRPTAPVEEEATSEALASNPDAAPTNAASTDAAPKVIQLEERRRPREGALSDAEEAAFRAIGLKLGERAGMVPKTVTDTPGHAPTDARGQPVSPSLQLPADEPDRPAEKTAEPLLLPADDAPRAADTAGADAAEIKVPASGYSHEPAERGPATDDLAGETKPQAAEEPALPAVVTVSPWASAPAERSADAGNNAGDEVATSEVSPKEAPLEKAATGETTARPVFSPEPSAEPEDATLGVANFATAAPEAIASEEDAPVAGEAAHADDAEEAVVDEAAEQAALAVDLEAVFASLPLPVLAEAHGRLVYGNREFQDLSGYESIEALEAAGGLEALFADRGDLGHAGELAIRRSSGQVIDVRVHMQRATFGGRSSLLMSFTPSPRDAAAVAHLPDAPEAAPETVDLRQQVEELQTVLDTATDGIVLLDPAGTIRGMNGSAQALFGTAEGDHSGRHLSTLFAHESQKATLDYLDMLRDDGLAGILNDGREVIGRVAQGGFIPLFITIGRLSGERGWCVVIRDIAHWKRIEEDLVNARRQAEAASLHKSRFLANISHELRTPLNAIIGFADVMASECFGPIGNERYLEYLGDIKRSGHHVLDLVNDLLDISKIEAGKLDLAFEAVSLNEVVSEVVSLMQPQANRERVIVRSNLPSSVPPVVADRRTMRQIALNLVANAIRFTPAGGQIIASTTYTAEGDVLLRFRDSGIGMTEREIEIALTPFQQVHAPSANRGEGTGLGLPLTKAMVEANRAQFAISSTPNEGTLVEIAFPSQRVLAD